MMSGVVGVRSSFLHTHPIIKHPYKQGRSCHLLCWRRRVGARVAVQCIQESEGGGEMKSFAYVGGSRECDPQVFVHGFEFCS
jgi:hypothetical protein